MKISPIMDEMRKYPELFHQYLVHTGQHYDDQMSAVFFDELGLNRPDSYLEVGSGSHATQTARVMRRFEPVVEDFEPEWVIVPGDVNSTLACALVASKLNVKVAHIEAGLRSRDRSMPEEINRLLTDHLSDLLFTPSSDANQNLEDEGIKARKIHLVGNLMIDTLVRLEARAESLWSQLRERFQLNRFILATLHRPSNVDDPDTLRELMSSLQELSKDHTVVFPIHPRTRQGIDELGLPDRSPALLLLPPLGYLEFVSLQKHASLVITDSGGIQEETTYLGIPCLTVRPNTERPVTISQGTNRLVASRRDAILQAARTVLAQVHHEQTDPPLFWDGRTSERIVRVFREL